MHDHNAVAGRSTAEPVSAIQGEVSRLNTRLEHLDRALGSLRDKLTSVLAGESPDKAANGQLVPRAIAASPLHDQLRTVGDTLESLTIRVDELTSRVTL